MFLLFLMFFCFIQSIQVIIDMTQKDPNNRLSVSEYLDILQGKTNLEPSTTIAEPSTTLLPPAPPALASGSPGPGSIPADGTHLPPRAPQSGSGSGGAGVSAAQAALTVFPGYFDAGLYPLFLKMHWNGVTPDDRINLICQVSFVLHRVSIRMRWIYRNTRA